jgi:phytanoyl-CoA hydroxylase
MVLTKENIDSFRAEGFLAIDHGVFSTQELDRVQERIDALYAKRASIPRRLMKHVEDVTTTPELCEILFATLLDPKLEHLEVVNRCRQIAAELLGRRHVWLHFDHVFYKESGNATTIPWHQDSAYSATHMTSRAVHFWIPFQDVDISNGCMKYVPASHMTGLRQHSRGVRVDGGTFRSIEVDEALAVSCPLQVGGLVCHSPMTMHGSGVNTSGALRRAWVLQFGVGPWVALRAAARPVLQAGVRLQMATEALRR